MVEWILVMTLNVIPPRGHVNDMALNTVDGFSSETKCKTAMNRIANSLLDIGNAQRQQQGIPTGNANPGAPSINARCIAIEK